MNRETPAAYYIQVDGKIRVVEGVSAGGAMKTAENEAARLCKSVWVYESRGSGYLVLGVCRPAHKHIKWGTFRFGTEKPARPSAKKDASRAASEED